MSMYKTYFKLSKYQIYIIRYQVDFRVSSTIVKVSKVFDVVGKIELYYVGMKVIFLLIYILLHFW